MDRLTDRFRLLENRKILIIGDSMLDRYEYGAVARISPEAPVPVFRCETSCAVPGGAANVAVNVAALGLVPSLMTLTGDDSDGKLLRSLLLEKGVDVSLLETDPDRPTTRKTRLIAQHNQQVLRMDTETDRQIDKARQDRLLRQLAERLPGTDLVLVSDYLKGFLPERFLSRLLSLCREAGVRTVVDIKSSDPDRYRGAYLLKPNLSELCRAMGSEKPAAREGVAGLAQGLLARTGAAAVLVTLGSEGMLLAEAGKEPLHLPSLAREVYDVTGAGDTVLACLGACLASEMSLPDAMRAANVAAGIKVRKVGTAAVRYGEVLEELLLMENGGKRPGKIVEGDAFVSGLLPGLRAAGRKIVFTNGCFDVLHVGHVRYLAAAAALGDLLIVGVNSDASVTRLKGPTRPVNPLPDRMELLAQLPSVDYVIPFSEDTPLRLITAIRPQVLVKGGDYTVETVVGGKEVLAAGGRVELIPLSPGRSTTETLRKLGKEN